MGTVDSGLNSMVLASNNEMVLFPVNEPTFGTKRKSQIQVGRRRARCERGGQRSICLTPLRRCHPHTMSACGPARPPPTTHPLLQTYLEQNEGPGLQHLALKTNDIIATLRQMRGVSDCGGFDFMPRPPDAYYRTLPSRIVSGGGRGWGGGLRGWSPAPVLFVRLGGV